MIPAIRSAGAIALFATTLLCGCSVQSFLDEPPAPQIYVLQPSLGPIDAPKVTWPLTVATPDAPLSLSDMHITIQRSPETLDFYANAAWQDRLPNLIQQALIEGFEQSGKIAAVAGPGQGLNAAYMLQTRLRRFEARYTSADGAPIIEVEIAARLVKLSSREIVASTVLSEQAAASANSIPSAVAAFDIATGKAVEDLVRWTLNAPAAQSNDRAKSGRAPVR